MHPQVHKILWNNRKQLQDFKETAINKSNEHAELSKKFLKDADDLEAQMKEFDVFLGERKDAE